MRRCFALSVAIASVAACTNFPARQAGPDVYSLPRSTEGPLRQLRGRVNGVLPDDESAYWLIDGSKEALDIRLMLMDEAVSSLDIQYFIWEPDPSGRLLLNRLIAAADRGVRVRLLMDDVTTTGRDNEYQALDSHPNIEVRYFNPWRLRFQLGRIGEYVTRFSVLNHRLHNKTIIADGNFGLIGGRNLGDRYFGLYDAFVQNDLDILFAGSMVDRVADDFDRYWNSRDSHDLDLYLDRPRRNATLDYWRSYSQEVIDENRDLLQAFPLAPTDWSDYMRKLGASYAEGKGEYFYDRPDIRDERPDQLYAEFKDFIDTAQKELIISTAYFVPDDEFIEELGAIVARGVRVVVFTNSLQTNNHTLAHVAYKRKRKDVLAAGVELYELKPHPAILEDYVVPPANSQYMGLHAKAVIVDGRWSFVGTPNVDPRAMLFNTENGIVVDSPQFAKELRDLLVKAMGPDNSWRVEFGDDGKVNWVDTSGVQTRQPANGFGERLKQFFIGLLPLKNQA